MEGSKISEGYPKQTRDRHVSIALALAVALMVISALNPRGAVSLSGAYVEGGSTDMTRAFATAVFVSIPLATAVLALLVAAMPYRDLPYVKRYPRAFLLTLIGIYGLMTVMGLVTLLRVYTGL